MCTRTDHDGACEDCARTDEWLDLTPTQPNPGDRVLNFDARGRPMSPMSRSDARKREIQDRINTMHEHLELAQMGVWPHPPTEPTQERTMTSPAQRRHEELVALLTEIRDRLPEPPPGYDVWIKGVVDPDLAARNLDAIKHEIETPMREHGECCEPAPADDLPGEPVEPGDLRAGDRVAFTWEVTGERITCALVGHQDGDVLCSDVPDSTGYAPDVVYCREWANVISDVRLIERASREDEDPDEALATDLFHASLAIPPVSEIGSTAWDDFTRRKWLDVARAARKHIAEEGPLAGELDAAVWHRQFEKEKARAEKAEGVRAILEDRVNLTRAAWDEWKESSRAGHAHATDMARLAEGWRARHAALRADVEALRRNPKSLTDVLMRAADALDRDDARAPQADPDTVTLPREVVFDLLHEWEVDPSVQVHSRVGEVSGIVRAALGWGDER